MNEIAKSKPTLLIAGLGKIGQKVCSLLSKQFHVVGLKRSAIELSDLNELITTDLLNTEKLINDLNTYLSEGADYLLYCLSPTHRSETGYRDIYIKALNNLLASIPNSSRLKRIVFISSTSVYGQDDHGWVNEKSQCEPKSYSGRILLEAEQAAQENSSSSTIIRFSGIYGGNRTQLISKVHLAAKSEAPILSDQERLSNRIHEDDCAGFIAHLFGKLAHDSDIEPLYLASDSEPSDLNDVMLYIAKNLDCKLSDQKTDSDTRRSGNKKCCNSLMLGSGYQLKYPSYREGYANINIPSIST